MSRALGGIAVAVELARGGRTGSKNQGCACGRGADHDGPDAHGLPLHLMKVTTTLGDEAGPRAVAGGDPLARIKRSSTYRQAAYLAGAPRMAFH